MLLASPTDGHGDVDLHSRPSEWRQVRGDKNGGYIFYYHDAGRDLDSHAGQGIGQSLYGKERLLGISGASQANDQAVSDQLIVTYAFNLSYVSKQYFVHGFGRKETSEDRIQRPANQVSRRLISACAACAIKNSKAIGSPW